MERQFEISKEDHLNIQLAEAVGVRHLAVSYPQVPVHSTQCAVSGEVNTYPGHQLHAGPGAHGGLGAGEGLHQRERAGVQVGLGTRASNEGSRRFHNH